MKRFFRIKWEIIMFLMLLVTTVYAWFVYFKCATEVRMLAIATITTSLCLMILCGYKTIKCFRREVLKMWQ